MKKTLAMLLALLTVIGLLAGCAKEPEVTPDPTPAPTPAPTPDNPNPTPTPTPDPVKPAEPFVYYYVRSGEETTLNVHDSNATNNINVNDRVGGMLYYYVPGADRKTSYVAPVYADGEPTVDASGLVWTIKLVKDAKWPDGEPITADDWIYSWKMQMDPKLYWQTGTSMASNFIEIKNGVDYVNSLTKNNGVKWEDVGIKKIDDYTLTVETVGKCTADEVKRHFYMRYSGLVKEEIYSKCISADGASCDYGTTLDKVAFAGQFLIETWNKGSEIVMVKNPSWPAADMIHIDKVITRVVTDESTRLELFEKGEADHIDLGTNGMAKYGEDPRVITYATKTINTLEVNQNHADPAMAKILNDPEFRKAIFYALDRTAIAKLVDSAPAPFFISTMSQMFADGTMYRDTPEAKALVEKNAPNNGYDTAKAVSYMDSVLKKNGLDKVKFSITYTETSDNLRACSEYIQSQFKTIFGDKVEIELRAMASSARLSMMRESTKQPVGTWELCWSGWSLAAENYYPWKKFDVYTSTKSNRYTMYKNTKLDDIYFNKCLLDENRLDEKKMLALTIEGEQAWYDDMTCVPVYGGVSNVMVQERIQLAVDNYTAGMGLGWYYSTLK